MTQQVAHWLCECRVWSRKTSRCALGGPSVTPSASWGVGKKRYAASSVGAWAGKKICSTARAPPSPFSCCSWYFSRLAMPPPTYEAIRRGRTRGCMGGNVGAWAKKICSIKQGSGQGEKRICSIKPSRVVPHRSTTLTRPSLTSLFGWEAVTLGDVAACDSRWFLMQYVPRAQARPPPHAVPLVAPAVLSSPDALLILPQPHRSRARATLSRHSLQQCPVPTLTTSRHQPSTAQVGPK